MISRPTNLKGYWEEGDACGDLECVGTMILKPTQGCTCFQCAPCSACMDNHPACDQCEWQDPDWERP